jgi:hypothetical protein
MTKIRFKIFANSDREKMVIVLANNGYKVWIEEGKKLDFGTDYYVCVEVEAIPTIDS